MVEKLCKCGCGEAIEVKPHHKYTGIPDYIHNHHRRGYKMTDDHKDKISKGNKYKKRTDEVRGAMSKARIQLYIDHPEIILKMSESQKKRFENPEEIEKNRQRGIKQFESEEAREIQRRNSIEQWSNQENRDEMSRIKKQYFEDNPEAIEKNRDAQLKYHEDNPEAREEARKKTLKQFSDPEAREAHRRIAIEQFSDPEARERMSAIKQGISYEDWEGFYQADWRDWQQTLLLNAPFLGCHRHHITETLAICIPAELHNHIRHTLKNGKNMGEMNMLALQFMNGGM